MSSAGVLWFTPQGIVMLIVILGSWTVFFYKENPWYWLSETMFLGAFAGIGLVTGWGSLSAVGGQVASSPDLIIALMLGALCFCSFYRPIQHLARWPIAIAAGVGAGLAIRTYIDVSFWVPIVATVNLAVPSTITGWIGIATGNIIDNIVFILVFIATLFYFMFSQKFTRYKGVEWMRRAAIFGIMICLGNSWGAFVMSRISQGLIGVIYVLTGHYPPYL